MTARKDKNMIALITGASSGIGRAMAHGFARRGFNLIITARRGNLLCELKKEITSLYPVRVKVIVKDLGDEEQCYELYEEVKAINPDVLINNAGFGLYGSFYDSDLITELDMIDVNIKAVHILTKLFYRDFRERNYGFILNVASVAGHMAGPYMATYYASKNYVVQLTKAIYEEIQEDKANVYIGALCPGPVNTEFNAVSGADFAIEGMSDRYVAEYAIEKMFDGELMIIPGALMKSLAVGSRIAPQKLVLRMASRVQKGRKQNK